MTNHHPGAAAGAEPAEPLGSFLRSRRERLSPREVGLPDGHRRRTPGLRREEVAQLAEISAEWLVRLEQGRATTPSAATLAALARALRLGDAEAAHLRRLARGGRPPAFRREAVPEALRRLVEGLPHPAYVTGLRWDVLAWNGAAAGLIADFGGLAPEDRNILLLVLTDPRGRALFGEAWAGEARRMVALFRATHDLRADDPAFAGLLARLRRGCPELDAWWAAHDVGEPGSGTKLLHHPTQGPVHFAYTTLQANDDPRLRLTVYAPG